MSTFRPLIILLAGTAILLAAPGVRAGALYKCDAADGSIAYTSSTQGYANCTTLSVFADPPKSPAGATGSASKPAKGWAYEENPREPAKAEFGDVSAAVAAAPPTILRADFAAASGGGSSSAHQVVAQDFSTVHADVASDARLVGNPMFIAAPYRSPLRSEAPRRPVASPAPVRAVASAPAKPRTLRGAVYKVQRKDGITEYTNIKPAGRTFAVLFTYISTCVACDIHSKIDFARTALNLDAYKDEVAAAAADFGVDGALLRAVIHAESAFNPMALSNKGAQGLMQLMPGTAGDLGVTDAFDVSQNIRGGARYLAQLLKNFNGDSRLATAAYNAGPGAVQKYGGIPPYDETQVYVQRVATLRERYSEAL
jgi:soluble lytic murein transglycosylase-like protein